MLKKYIAPFSLLLLLLSAVGCKSKIKQLDDQIYSRHLQRQVKLTIISTPMPADKTELNLLILNDGQEIGQFGVKDIIDSLYKKKLINPVLVVGVHAGDRMKEFGVGDQPDYLKRGDKAADYDEFINDELFAYAKKNATVRKFKSVVIAGCSQGGLSAFDIAWTHAAKIDKVGVFSGSFWWRGYAGNNPTGEQINQSRIMQNLVKSSTKRAGMKFWFEAGTNDENGDRDGDGIIDAIDDTKDLMLALKTLGYVENQDYVYVQVEGGQHNQSTWSQVLDDFLIWCYGK